MKTLTTSKQMNKKKITAELCWGKELICYIIKVFINYLKLFRKVNLGACRTAFPFHMRTWQAE